MMKISKIIILFSLVFSTPCFSQNKLSTHTKRILRKLEKTTRPSHQGGYPSFYGNSNELDSLEKYATVHDLLILMKNDNGAIKAYAFDALLNKSYPKIFELIENNIENEQSIAIYAGDIIEGELLIDYFIDQVNPNYIYQSKQDSIKLSKHQLTILDSLLLFKNIAPDSYYQKKMLLKLPPKKNYYNRVRSLALSNNGAALVALAKYQNPKDLELIRQSMFKDNSDYYAMLAIQEYPAPSLFPLLAKKLNKEIKKHTGFDYQMLKEMFQAIVKYKNEAAKKLLIKTINKATPEALNYHKVYIVIAIKKYQYPIFNDLLDKIKLTDFQKKEVKYGF